MNNPITYWRKRHLLSRASERYYSSLDNVLWLGLAATAGYLLAGGKIPAEVLRDATTLLQIEVASAKLQLLKDRIAAGDYLEDQKAGEEITDGFRFRYKQLQREWIEAIKDHMTRKAKTPLDR